MANPRADWTFTFLLIMYFTDGTNRECGGNTHFRSVQFRTGCEIT